MSINRDAEYDEATLRAIEVLRAYDFSLEALNTYIRMFEPDHAILFTMEWERGKWTGHAQYWINDSEAGGSLTIETYPTHREALGAILRDRVIVEKYEN
jgi:hypothetical protein